MNLQRVFEPISIGSVEIPNRIVRTGHVTGLGNGGGVTDDLIAYHEARAAGGVGLLYLEHSSLHRTSPSSTIRWADDRVIPGFREVSNAVHRHGARMFQQILHRGPQCTPVDGSAPLAASPVATPGAIVTPKAATADELGEIVAAYAAAGDRAREGGLDGVEVLAGHGYLIHTFLSPHFNLRNDEYGGSAENRMSLLVEILEAMRRRLPGFPVGVRLSVSEHVEGGISPDDTLGVALRLEAAELVDFVNLSVGGYGNPTALSSMIGPMYTDHGYQLSITEPVAAALGSPTIVTGRILTLYEAEAVLERGDADLVSMVRATIADPDLVRKTRSGLVEQVRPCIGCNQGCIGGIWGPSARLGCVVNVRAGREHDTAPPGTTAQPRRVVVVGGGPAGLEAARVAAEAGHHVTLIEQEAALGGQIRHAVAAPHRQDMAPILSWWERELDRFGVRVMRHCRADRSLVSGLEPDVVFLATGSRPPTETYPTKAFPRGLKLEGDPRVFSSWDVVEGHFKDDTTHDVVVIDDLGHYEALGVAEALIEGGHSVTFVTADGAPGALISATMTAETTVERLVRRGVRFVTGYDVAAVEGALVRVTSVNGGSAEDVRADAVVFVGSMQADDSLLAELGDLGVPVRVIGDAAGPRDLQAAVREGYLAASALD